MTKMTLADLKALFPVWSNFKAPDGLRDTSGLRHSGSKKRARHNHKPVWLPGKPRISPAKYRRLHRGRKQS